MATAKFKVGDPPRYETVFLTKCRSCTSGNKAATCKVCELKLSGFAVTDVELDKIPGQII
jgi:hypothetical protein